MGSARVIRPGRAVALAVLVALAGSAAPARAGVVINEILYHAPGDRDDLQFVELHNPGDRPVDLGGWKLARGVRHEFPAGTAIDAGGYLVVCKNLKAFREAYKFDAAGAFQGSLDHGGEGLELRDAAGKVVDRVRYRTRAPWPVSPDGSGPSLERICPAAPGDSAENWAASPLTPGAPRPGGTPGKKNIAFAAAPPPVVSDVTVTPPNAPPGREITVRAVVRAAGEPKAVELRYRVAGAGAESEEVAIPMTKGADGRYSAAIPGQKAGQLVRLRVRAADAAGGERFFPHPHDLRPALSVYVHDPFEPGKVPLGFIISAGKAEFRAAQKEDNGGFDGPQPDPPDRGNSAFIYVDPKVREPQVFDFVSVTPRRGGRKIRFHRDRPLNDMTTINLIYEYMDRFVLAEPLAYDVYRKAGLAAPRADHVRTWIDGRPIGFQLLVEQPNKAFLRHNGLDAGGNLYKAVWFGDTVVSRHEKKTHTRAGHDDLVKLVDRLTKTKGDDQWAVIKAEFDVAQVATHYAVRTILSDWDGFFNNYYLYHDTGGTGRWTLYPWDQDKTWGFHDGTRGYEAFFDMPITLGMAGDTPVNGAWWRPGGDVAKPLLANPQFRKVFLARVKDLLERVYTEKEMLPAIQALGERLEDEVRYRAKVRGENTDRAVEHFRRNLDSLREHLTKRREFLLKQESVKSAGKFDPADFK